MLVRIYNIDGTTNECPVADADRICGANPNEWGRSPWREHEFVDGTKKFVPKHTVRDLQKAGYIKWDGTKANLETHTLADELAHGER